MKMCDGERKRVQKHADKIIPVYPQCWSRSRRVGHRPLHSRRYEDGDDDRQSYNDCYDAFRGEMHSPEADVKVDLRMTNLSIKKRESFGNNSIQRTDLPMRQLMFLGLLPR